MSVYGVSDKPFIIGLTGGIGTGKSEASKYFKTLHVPVIDSDQIVSNLWKSEESMILKAEEAFGFQIRSDRDKKKLAELIFSDEKKRAKINEIVHPYVFKEIEEQKRLMERFPFIVIDMPLLIESKYCDRVDHVLLIYASPKHQIKRLMARDGMTEAEAILRVNSQMSIDQKKKYAGTIIYNEREVKDLHHEIKRFIEALKHEKQQFIPTP